MGLKAGDNVNLAEEAGQLVLKPIDDDFARQVEHAERFMETYKVALKKLAE